MGSLELWHNLDHNYVVALAGVATIQSRVAFIHGWRLLEGGVVRTVLYNLLAAATDRSFAVIHV